MALHARKTSVPFVGLSVALIVIVGAFLWDFFRRGDFTVGAFGNLGLLCVIVFVPSAMVYVDIRRGQSAQFDEEGVSVELLSFSGRAGVLPNFHIALLPWSEVHTVSLKGHIIILQGASRSVRINTIYFKDVGQVFKLIEQYVPAPQH